MELAPDPDLRTALQQLISQSKHTSKEQPEPQREGKAQDLQTNENVATVSATRFLRQQRAIKGEVIERRPSRPSRQKRAIKQKSRKGYVRLLGIDRQRWVATTEQGCGWKTNGMEN
ncbi:hypothetical protein MMC31_000944 [Peltigera leucophlebia]|nr:hypothetical protein [Peltigera leucophlebia]